MGVVGVLFLLLADFFTYKAEGNGVAYIECLFWRDLGSEGSVGDEKHFDIGETITYNKL